MRGRHEFDVKAFRFGKEARADFADAVDYYRAIQPELAEDFVRRIETAILRASEFPRAGSTRSAPSSSSFGRFFMAPATQVHGVRASRIYITL